MSNFGWTGNGHLDWSLMEQRMEEEKMTQGQRNALYAAYFRYYRLTGLEWIFGGFFVSLAWNIPAFLLCALLLWYSWAHSHYWPNRSGWFAVAAAECLLLWPVAMAVYCFFKSLYAFAWQAARPSVQTFKGADVEFIFWVSQICFAQCRILWFLLAFVAIGVLFIVPIACVGR